MLTFLTHAGLVIAAISSIWGTTHELRVSKDGEKVLSLKGYVAIAFTVLGLLVSIAARIVSDEQAAQTRHKEIQEEIARTNQIIASQPLLSLDMEWRFSDLPKSLSAEVRRGLEADIQHHEEAQIGMISGDHADDINRALRLFPFLRALPAVFVPEDERGREWLRELERDAYENPEHWQPDNGDGELACSTTKNIVILTRISILALVRWQYTPALRRIPRLFALNPAHHLRR